MNKNLVRAFDFITISEILLTILAITQRDHSDIRLSNITGNMAHIVNNTRESEGDHQEALDQEAIEADPEQLANLHRENSNHERYVQRNTT